MVIGMSEKKRNHLCFHCPRNQYKFQQQKHQQQQQPYTDSTKKRKGSKVLHTCWHKKTTTSIPKEFISNNLTMAFKSISKAIGNQPKSFQTFWWVCFLPFDLLVQHHWSALQHMLFLYLHWYSIVYWRLQWIPYTIHIHVHCIESPEQTCGSINVLVSMFIVMAIRLYSLFC